MKPLLVIISLLCSINFASENELPFGVHRVYEPLSISEVQLADARTLSDLNQHFDPQWVRSYHSVILTLSINGSEVTVNGIDEIFNSEQLKALQKADTGSSVKVTVNYTPENSLKHNEPKVFDFSIKAYPEHEALFLGGKDQMMKILREEAVENIPSGSITGFALAAVEFTIDENGELVNPAVAESTGSKDLDKLLLDAVCKLDKWKPAAYADGTTVSESYMLTVGSMESCTVNLLNIRKNNF